MQRGSLHAARPNEYQNLKLMKILSIGEKSLDRSCQNESMKNDRCVKKVE